MKSYLSKTSDIAVAAAEQISKYKKDKEAAETLMAATGSRDKETMVKCIRYAGDVEYKGIVPKLVGLFRHKELDAAKESVDSCAKIRSKDSIDPLLKLWTELDGIKEDKSNSGGGRAAWADSAAAASPARRRRPELPGRAAQAEERSHPRGGERAPEDHRRGLQGPPGRQRLVAQEQGTFKDPE